ncbi:MAG: hypothetical protein QQN41_10135, partial [Nitrosopumilus sp.]
SARGDLPKEIYALAEETGKEIIKRGHVLITGAAKGISAFATKGAKEIGGKTIGVSPTANNSEKENYEVDFEFLDEIIHTGDGYKGRNVIGVRKCDGMIAINGGFGTLNEITIAEGEGKPIVILEKSGGCCDIIKDIFEKLNSEYNYFQLVKTPKEAVSKVIDLIEKQRSKNSTNTPKV